MNKLKQSKSRRFAILLGILITCQAYIDYVAMTTRITLADIEDALVVQLDINQQLINAINSLNLQSSTKPDTIIRPRLPTDKIIHDI